MFDPNDPASFDFDLPEDDPNDGEAPTITFHNADIDFVLPHPAKTQDWIQQVIQEEESVLTQLNFIFCSDTYLHAINVEYLDHDTLTDVITFPFAPAPEVEGDIYISIDRVRENASDLKVDFSEELHRVMIHGVLHLCGYQDKTPNEQQRMREKENEKLALLR